MSNEREIIADEIRTGVVDIKDNAVVSPALPQQGYHRISGDGSGNISVTDYLGNTSIFQQILKGGVNTTDATATTIITIPTSTDQSLFVKAFISGRRTGGTAGATNDSYAAERTLRVKNDGGTLSIYSVTSNFTSKDQNAFTCIFIVSGTDVLVQVQGAANNNLSWMTTAQVLAV